MVMFAQNQAEIENGYFNAAQNPYDPSKDSTAGFLEGAPTATAIGAGQALAQANLFFGDAADPYVKAFTQPIDQLFDTGLSGNYDKWRKANLDNVLALQPDPQVTGWLGQNILYPLSGTIPTFMMGGPVTAGSLQAYATARRLQNEGVDSATAVGAGLIAGGTLAIAGSVPAAVSGKIVTRAVTGGAINEAMGMGQRGATSALLEANGYHDMAAQYKILDGTAMFTDWVLGTAFGVLHTGGKSKAYAELLPSDIDAALAGNNIHQLELDSAPGIPTDIATRNSHVAAMNLATEQMLKGETVDVSQSLKQTNFVPKPEDTQTKAAWDESLKEGNYQVVYHGTPHEFDSFSLEKIGTGEGAQAFGHGLYFTDNKSIAEHYRLGLSTKDFISKAKAAYDEFDAPDEALTNLMAIKGLSESQRELLVALDKEGWLGFDYPHQAVKAAITDGANYDLSPEIAAAVNKQGNLYAAKIPTDEVMLHWDRAMDDQPQSVQKALARITNNTVIATWKKNGAWEKVSGEVLYKHLTKQGITKGNLVGIKSASETLNALGIRGIKYPADMGRGKRGESGHNYVIFDDKAVHRVAQDSAVKPIEQLLSKESHTQAKDAVVQNGIKTGTEHAILLGDDNLPVYKGSQNDSGRVGVPKGLIADANKAVVLHHNHPSGRALSAEDISGLANPGLRTVIAHTHEGLVSAASLTADMKRFLSSKKPKKGEAELSDLWRKAEDPVRDTFLTAINEGKITAEQANELHDDVINRAFAKRGIIDYHTTFSDKAVSAQVLAKVQKVADGIVKSLADERGYPDARTDAVVHNTTRAVLPDKGVAGIPDKSGEGRNPGRDQSGSSRQSGASEAERLASEIAAEKPDLQITTDSGTISAIDALAKADEEIAKAEQDSKLFETAINCLLRNGDEG